MEIPNKLQKELELYCKVNNITDIEAFALKMLQQGFNIERYGIKPNIKIETVVKTDETKVEKPIEKNKDFYDED
jgi:hypothetical protein